MSENAFEYADGADDGAEPAALPAASPASPSPPPPPPQPFVDMSQRDLQELYLTSGEDSREGALARMTLASLQASAQQHQARAVEAELDRIAHEQGDAMADAVTAELRKGYPMKAAQELARLKIETGRLEQEQERMERPRGATADREESRRLAAAARSVDTRSLKAREISTQRYVEILGDETVSMERKIGLKNDVASGRVRVR